MMTTYLILPTQQERMDLRDAVSQIWHGRRISKKPWENYGLNFISENSGVKGSVDCTRQGIYQIGVSITPRVLGIEENRFDKDSLLNLFSAFNPRNVRYYENRTVVQGEFFKKIDPQGPSARSVKVDRQFLPGGFHRVIAGTVGSENRESTNQELFESIGIDTRRFSQLGMLGDCAAIVRGKNILNDLVRMYTENREPYNMQFKGTKEFHGWISGPLTEMKIEVNRVKNDAEEVVFELASKEYFSFFVQFHNLFTLSF